MYAKFFENPYKFLGNSNLIHLPNDDALPAEIFNYYSDQIKKLKIQSPCTYLRLSKNIPLCDKDKEIVASFGLVDLSHPKKEVTETIRQVILALNPQKNLEDRPKARL